MPGLEGKRAIVTGASSGIGAATAKALADAGASVVSGSRRDGSLDVTDAASSPAVLGRRARRARRARHPGQQRRPLTRARPGVGVASGGRAPGDRDQRPGPDADDAALRAAPHRLGGGSHRQPRLGGRDLVVRERLVVRRVEVRRARVHARAARRPAGEAGADHERRAGPRRDGLLRVRFGGDEEKARAVYSNVAMGGPLHAEDVADSILFALTRPANVNIDEIVLTALAQTSGGNILRES